MVRRKFNAHSRASERAVDIPADVVVAVYLHMRIIRGRTTNERRLVEHFVPIARRRRKVHRRFGPRRSLPT